MLDFIMVMSDEEYTIAVSLFKEYAAWLNVDLSFQDFDKELEGLKSMYALPFGGIILCKHEQKYIGCVAVRKITVDIAEIKRMYVLPAWQGKGIGNELLVHSINLAVKCGYSYVRLDTLNTMYPAINLYKKNGFVQIEAYYKNPISTAVYFEKQIKIK